nr:unnamed protein product [Leishmania braziliensis]
MSFTEEVSDAPISITGEMWVCADSTGPSKVGAGRGLKNFITIEKDLFCAYSSRSAQSKQTKQVAFRSMKRVAWFTHRPTPPVRGSSASTTTAALRRRGSKDVLTVYYYLVLEFLRDNTCPGTVSLGKRERIVLCTDDQQDFLIWRKFADLYGSSLVHEGLVEGREKRSLKSQRNADGVPDHDDTTSSDDDGEGHGLSGGAVCRRSLDLWKNRCVALLNDFAHLSNPSLQVKSADIFEAPADCGGLSWDAHAESVLHAIEQGMHPLMKVVPAKSSEDRIVGLSSLLSSPSTTPASILPGASATAAMVTHVDEMQSQADNLRMELRRFQEVTGEVGSLVEGSKLKATMMSPDTLHAYLERLRKVLTSSEPANNVATQRVDKTVTKTSVASADLAKLEGVCKAAVRSFTEKVSTNALPLSEESNRQKAKQQEQEELPQRMETVVAVLLDELARATADVRSLKASLAQSTALTEPSPARNLSVELNELRRVLNRKELEVETLQQQNFDANRQTKQLSRRLEEVVFSYGEVAHDMLRSQYREYASLRSLFLPALCGEVPLDSSTATEASFAASSSFDGIREARPTSYSQVPSSGMQKLVISTAHLEAIQALEQERSAARERQRELEEVMKELEVLRQERDEEIANLKYNFLAAEEAWERDMAILQAKLSAVQSAVPQGVDLLSNALLTNNTTEKSGIAQKLTSTPLHDTAAPVDVPESPLIVAQMAVKRQERLKELATLLGTTPSETSLEDDVAYQRLQDFYTWAREVVAPLSTTSSFEGSLLDMITSIVHAYQAVLQQASTIYTDATSSKDDSSLNLADIMKNEHDQLEKLWKIIDEHLLTQELRNALVSSTPQPLEERAALSFSSPPTVAELDQLPPLIQHVSSNAALYFQLQLRSGEIPLALYIQHLENKLEQLEQTLQQNDVQQKIIEDRSATHQPLPQNTSPHNDPIHLRGSLPDVEASPSEPCGAVIARAAAGAAERERVLRADLAAAEERQQAVESRLEAARTEQERVEADREELREGVADALAALGVEASPSEPCGAVIARAAAGAAERERVLRADLAAAEERQQAVESRLEAARTEQERVEADREELREGVADALAALGVEASPSEPCGAVIARAAAGAAERERVLRADLAAAEERQQAVESRLEAARTEQERVEADREELREGVADALAALGVEASPSEPCGAVIARAAAGAAERERVLRADLAAAEERQQAVESRLEAARTEQERVEADREELREGVADALAALGVEASPSEPCGAVIARAAAGAAERERVLRADLAAAEERQQAVESRLEAARTEQERVEADREELREGVADALAALGVEASPSEPCGAVIARAAAGAAERERVLRADLAAAEERQQAVESRLEAARTEQERVEADREELREGVADALAALGVEASPSEPCGAVIARAAAGAAERERVLRADLAAAEERQQAVESRLEAARTEQERVEADREELREGVADALAALGVEASPSEPCGAVIARAAAGAAERERVLRADLAAAEERQQAVESRLEAARTEQERVEADREELREGVADALAALGVEASPSEPCGAVIARAAAGAAERERVLRADLAAAEERQQAVESRLEAARTEQERVEADREELREGVADALAALGVEASPSEPCGAVIARAAAGAAERERVLRADLAAAEERQQAVESRLEAARTEQERVEADREELREGVADALAALGVEASPSEPCGAVIARAAAGAAERERVLRADLAAAEERQQAVESRLEAARTEQERVEADREELREGVADALAALGVEASPSEPCGAVIARAAAGAAERERVLRADLAAAEERQQAVESRLEAARTEQERVEADREELREGVADALAALGVEASPSEPCGAVIARAAAGAAERERVLRADLAAAEERQQAVESRLEAARTEQERVEADREELREGVADALAALGVEASPSEPCGAVIARAAAGAAERERVLRADLAAAEERQQAVESRLEAARTEQERVEADREELREGVADALAALGVEASPSEPCGAVIARAAAGAAERERVLRADLAAAEERQQAVESRLEAARTEQERVEADREELREGVADALAALGVEASPSEPCGAVIARAAAGAAERERVLRADLAAAEERQQAVESRLEAARTEQERVEADREELREGVADALAALGVEASPSEPCGAVIARAAAGAAERERVLRADLAAAEERQQAVESRLEAARTEQERVEADREELREGVADALAALGVEASPSEPCGAVIARAAAGAAERERVLRADLAAAEERQQAVESRLEAARTEQERVEADREELREGVADALAALGVEASPSEPCGAVIARAAAGAAERERVLRADLAAAEERQQAVESRLEAARTEQERVEADREELREGVADALAALGVEASPSEPCGAVIARAAAGAAERERVLRADLAAAEERQQAVESRLEAARTEQERVEADREELREGVADALAALGVEASPSEPCGAVIARAAAGAAERERVLRADLAAAEERQQAVESRLEAARTEQERVEADREELREGVADALAALGVEASPSEPCGAVIARAAAGAAERERVLRADLAAAEERQQAVESRLEAARTEQERVEADREELREGVADALAALGVEASPSEPCGAVIARAAAGAAERERVLRADLAAAEERQQAVESRLEAARTEQERVEADREELREGVADALAALGVEASPSEPCGAVIARAAAGAAERERVLRADLAAAEERQQAVESRLEAARTEQERVEADREELREGVADALAALGVEASPSEPCGAVIARAAAGAAERERVLRADLAAAEERQQAVESRLEAARTEQERVEADREELREGVADALAALGVEASPSEPCGAVIARAAAGAAERERVLRADLAAAEERQQAVESRLEAARTEQERVEADREELREGVADALAALGVEASPSEPCGAVIARAAAGAAERERVLRADLAAAEERQQAVESRLEAARTEQERVEADREELREGVADALAALGVEASPSEPCGAVIARAAAGAAERERVLRADLAAAEERQQAVESRLEAARTEQERVEADREELREGVADALAALGVEASPSEPCGAVIARAAAGAAERERVLRADLAAAEERQQAVESRLEAARTEQERVEADREELREGVADALAALGVEASPSEPCGAVIARAAAGAAERERVLRADLAAAEERQQAVESRLEAARTEQERVEADREELREGVADALAALGVEASPSEPCGAVIARAAAGAAERERVLRADLAAAEERQQAVESRLEAARTEQERVEADREELREGVADALAALGVEASPSEPCGAVIARAAAGAAERERVLRADLAAAEERQQAVESRLEAARTEQERVEADREELREGVADALAALGVEASPSEPCGAVIARAAAGAAERERVLRADLAAAEERQQAVESRLEAARTEQERVEADREELREGVADALAALGVEASPSEPCGAVIARAAAGAAERERVLRADLAAAEERQQAVESRLEAARTEQERVEADREELREGVADALAALGVEASPSEPCGAVIARAPPPVPRSASECCARTSLPRRSASRRWRAGWRRRGRSRSGWRRTARSCGRAWPTRWLR